MPGKPPASTPSFNSFGALLRYLRKRARLTQRELGAAVGYSEAHISRIERDERGPDEATVAARFIQALDLKTHPELADLLLSMAAGGTRGRTPVGSTGPAAGGGLPTNLPYQMTSFFGREAEKRDLLERLTSPTPQRLVTLTGPGGIGKTRLAIETAFSLLSEFPDGIWFIDLAPITTSETLHQALAVTLNLHPIPARPANEVLVAALQTQHTLLLVDNCEHLVQPAAGLIEDLLKACPKLQVIATSRSPLRVGGEVILTLAPLPVPGDTDPGLETIADQAAVQMFVHRAQSALPGFHLNEGNAAALSRLIRRLEGIPLAIELAAARIPVLSVDQIEERLEDRFGLLTRGNASGARHQTLRSAIEWSHDLLNDSERALFRQLSVFRGGWTLEACAAVCGEDALENLTGLVERSLAVVEMLPGETRRFKFLETLRDFASDQLDRAGESHRTQTYHFEYFLGLAGRARTFGPEKNTWLNRLEAEHDNFSAAIEWVLSGSGDSISGGRIDQALQMAGDLADHCFYRGFSMEARRWLDRLLTIDQPDSRARALGFQKAGFLARVHGEYGKAVTLLEQGLRISRRMGDSHRTAWSLLDLGICLRDLGRTKDVLPAFQEARSLFMNLNDEQGIVESAYMLAETFELGQQLEKAASFWESGLEAGRRAGDPSYIAWGLEGLGGIAFLQGNHDRSAELHAESLALKSLVMDKAGMAYSLEGLAQASAGMDQLERAGWLWGAAARLRTEMSLPLDPSRRHIYSSHMAGVRARVGDSVFESWQAKGQGLSLADAIDLALGKTGS